MVRHNRRRFPFRLLRHRHRSASRTRRFHRRCLRSRRSQRIPCRRHMARRGHRNRRRFQVRFSDHRRSFGPGRHCRCRYLIGSPSPRHTPCRRHISHNRSCRSRHRIRRHFSRRQCSSPTNKRRYSSCSMRTHWRQHMTIHQVSARSCLRCFHCFRCSLCYSRSTKDHCLRMQRKGRLLRSAPVGIQFDARVAPKHEL